MSLTISSLVRRSCSLTIALTAIACSRADTRATKTDSATATAPSAEAQLMAQGLEQLTSDPISAVTTFRSVLAANATHYGAHFQLAKALDLSGHPDSARTWWNKVVVMADAVQDTLSASTARARLALPDTVSQEAMMRIGLHTMNVQNNPAAAAVQFRALLQRNPTHYGATYQLAQALDKAGDAVEAHKVWITVLGMATSYKDQPSIDVATARLRRNP